MKCPNCQSENPEGMKFCVECGKKLEILCPKCGFNNSPTFKFCGQCGHDFITSKGTPSLGYTHPQSYTPNFLADKILASKSALEGERKQVTVLFADLKGSMELIADRDPEEARKLLDPVVERMMGAVHHYEGTVTHIMGDGIMALFGAPLAHEDHAVRACYAALRMQEAIRRHNEELRRSQGVEVRIRVGLNSGEVVVGSIGSDLHMEYTALGHTTHLAARMEQLATPGSIRITAETLRLAEGFIEVKSLGPIPVKGLAEPAEIYEITGARSVRTRLEVAAGRGLSRFVGRNPEMEQLRHALDQAAGGRGQVVAVVGEPGVGKSRLFYEFIHSHRTQGWLVLESSSVSYGKATVYFPVIGLLKSYFKIHDNDNQREILERITGKLLTLDPALEPTRAAFLALFDVPAEGSQWQSLDPLHRRQRTLDAVKRLLLRESQVQPLLLVFEDLHWIDGETQLLLDSLIESLPASRLLLLVNYRPEYSHAWGSKTYYRQLRLDTLQPESSSELLQALLGDDPALTSLKELLVTRTGGNPLFLEESVAMLVETKTLQGKRGEYHLAREAPTVKVPGTVQAILSARIDRLPPEEKRLLQSASVIGKDVPFQLLNAIAEKHDEELRHDLSHLQAAEFIYEANLFPELEYTFKHALTLEVAYNSLLQDRRASLHKAIMEAIELLYPERMAEQMERLALHAFRGEVWTQAPDYLRRAGAGAAWRSAHREAAGYFEQALTSLNHLPESSQTIRQAIDLHFDLRGSRFTLGELPRAFESLQKAEYLAKKLGDQRQIGRVMVYFTHYFWSVGLLDQALEKGELSLSILKAIDDFELKILANFNLGQVYHARGDYHRAIDSQEWCLNSLENDQMHRPISTGQSFPFVTSCMWLLWSLSEVGRFSEGVIRADQALQLAEAADHLFSLFHACYGAGTLFLQQGDLQRAIPLLERSRWISQTGHLPYMNTFALSPLGFAYVLDGRIEEGLGLIEEAVQQSSLLGMMFCHSFSVAYAAEAYLLGGQIDKAAESAGRALQLCRDYKARGYSAWTFRLLGDIASHPQAFDSEKAEGYYGQAISLAEEMGMYPLVAHCHLSFGRLYHQVGKWEQALNNLKKACSLFQEMGMDYWLARTRKVLEGLQIQKI